MPHLDNTNNKSTDPVISRQEYHLTQPCPSEENQSNKQKLSTNLTLYKAHTNHWTNLRRAETKGRMNSTVLKERIQLSLKPGKGDLKHNNLKNNNEKTEKYCTNEKTN